MATALVGLAILSILLPDDLLPIRNEPPATIWVYPADGEGPVREVSVDSFWVDRFAVSNEDFAEFIEATGYATEAERFGWSFVFEGLLPDDFPPTQSVIQTPWWRKVDGSDWRHPRDLSHRLTNAVIIRSCISPGPMRRPIAPGPASAC